MTQASVRPRSSHLALDLFRAVAGLALLAVAVEAHATEGAVGRPVTGTGVVRGQGVVPPTPYVVGLNVVQYSGSMDHRGSVPIAGQVAVGIEPQFWLAAVQLLHIWNPEPAKWNFASGAVLPYVGMDIEAGLTIGDTVEGAHDDASGLYDLALIPITAGYHFSETEHLSLTLTVWAPTGAYEVGRLANPGLNVWTLVPSVAFTKYLPARGLEFTGNWSLQFASENPDTDYRSGVLSTLDVLAEKKFANQLGVGAVFGWIEQLSDDEGGISKALDGFRGHSLGIGPIVSYSTRLGGKTPLEMDFRWVHEFDVDNRPDGDAFQLTVTAIF